MNIKSQMIFEYLQFSEFELSNKHSILVVITYLFINKIIEKLAKSCIDKHEKWLNIFDFLRGEPRLIPI